MIFNNEFTFRQYVWMNHVEGVSTNGAIILAVINECNEREVKVTGKEIAEFLGISPTTVYKQIKILKEKGIIDNEWRVIYHE